MMKYDKLKQILLLISLIFLIPDVTLAQKRNLDNLVLAVGSKKNKRILTGNTGGAYSLASISNRDIQGNPCLGYGDPQPDHIVILKSKFAQLKMQIENANSDTTLIIKNLENNRIRCAFRQHNTRDIVIQDRNWSPGTYYIWVGSMYPNQRSPYRLSVQR